MLAGCELNWWTSHGDFLYVYYKRCYYPVCDIVSLWIQVPSYVFLGSVWGMIQGVKYFLRQWWDPQGIQCSCFSKSINNPVPNLGNLLDGQSQLVSFATPVQSPLSNCDATLLLMVSKTALAFSAERFLVSLKCGTYRHPCEGDGLLLAAVVGQGTRASQ